MVFGLGVVGRKRAMILNDLPTFSLEGYIDIDRAETGQFGKSYSWEDFYAGAVPEIDCAFVCLPTYLATDIVQCLLEKKVSVFCEKPPARSAKELEKIDKKLLSDSVHLMYGFNHRYHCSVIKAASLISSGELGEIIDMRGVYGKSQMTNFSDGDWRTDLKMSGGGILIDQGIHMLDLFRFFGGDLKLKSAIIGNTVWGCEVEDNVLALLEGVSSGIPVFLHSSASHWKHKFSLDIGLTKGFISLTGLVTGTRSYGEEVITFGYKRDGGRFGSPNEESLIFQEDLSWIREINKFYDQVVHEKNVDSSLRSLEDAAAVLELIRLIYEDFYGLS